MSRGTILESVVKFVVSEIVMHPEQVKVNLVDTGQEGEIIAEVQTAETDLGRVIGRNGRVARTIRTIAQAAGDEEGVHAGVEFIE